MSSPTTSALSRRDRLWPAVAASVLAHALLGGWALAGRSAPAIDLEQKPIVAKLVRLGEKRPEQWLPRKEAPPPAPAPAPAAPVTVPAAPPARPATASRAAKPAPSPVPAAPAAPGRAGGTTLASVLSKVQRQVDDTRYGSPDGDASGDSDTGEGDRYLALVVRSLRANYRVPSTISERDRLHLKGTLVLFIESDGRIARWRFETRSGNAAFDDALERTLQQTRLPPPPPDGRELYRSTGLQVLFQIG
jgi:colicin import membrane protein/protein TonB